MSLLTVCYTDPEAGVRGYLVIDGLVRGVAAGGLRIHPTVSIDELTALARNMALKQQVAGIQVGGAKAGLAMDPAAPERREVLRRFLGTLQPMIEAMYSVGPDLGTTMAELDSIGREAGIPCLKIAVGRSRGVPDAEFLRRYALLEERVEGFTVNALRAASAVQAAAAALAGALGVERPRVALQGAGGVGGATAWLLAREGARIVAWADDEKCRKSDGGLDVRALLAARRGGRLPWAEAEQAPSAEVLRTPCDILVLAAVSRAFGVEEVPRLACRGVVEAANLALEPDVEEALHAAGILVVPDLIAGAGGSLAVEALYTADPRDGQAILDHVTRRAGELARDCLARSRATGRTPRAAAMERAR